MSHLFYLLLFAGSFSPHNLFAQKKWTGSGGDNQWNTASNWTGNSLPLASEDVILDNSIFSGSYIVSLPAIAVTIKTIQIAPSPGKVIELVLPQSNLLTPGLTVDGPGYGMTINDGGIFRNSSGASSGDAVDINDSIKLNNKGKYIHNSASGHTGIVQVLAAAGVLGSGIVELDIPAASSTISFSGRTFGTFSLKCDAAGGACNYTAAGTNSVIIKSDLLIGSGVTLTLNCSDTIFVYGDFVQYGGVVNLGSSGRSVVLSLRENISQHVGAVITETGTGLQTILINGSGAQQIDLRGALINDIALVKDGTGSAVMIAPVSLPYKLELRKGRMVTTHGLITLMQGSTISADTLSDRSYVEGPLKKEGLVNQSFLFPVGELGRMRWLQLKNATGNFTVTYFRNDPHTLNVSTGNGIDHFSKVEYWNVTSAAGSTSHIKLSFVRPGSGVVTDLSTLRVARLINGTWEDAGNSGVAGTTGSDGWVSSNAVSGFSARDNSFALASASGQENPLPLSSVTLRAVKKEHAICFSWQITGEMVMRSFDLECSEDGVRYSLLRTIVAGRKKEYFCEYQNTGTHRYFRIVATSENGKSYISNVFPVRAVSLDNIQLRSSNTVKHWLLFEIGKPEKIMCMVFDPGGKMIGACREINAYGIIRIDVSYLPAGSYFVRLHDRSGNVRNFRFIKI